MSKFKKREWQNIDYAVYIYRPYQWFGCQHNRHVKDFYVIERLSLKFRRSYHIDRRYRQRELERHIRQRFANRYE